MAKWWKRHKHVYDIDTGEKYTVGTVRPGGRSAYITFDDSTEWHPVMACACGKREPR